jgi:hypothetical protein
VRTLSLSRPVTLTLTSGGNGTLQLGPDVPGETWYPASVQITSTGTTTVATLATCTIYAGNSAAPSNFVDATYNIFAAASSIIAGQVIHPGQYVFAVFAGAAALATATLVVNGSRTVP